MEGLKENSKNWKPDEDDCNQFELVVDSKSLPFSFSTVKNRKFGMKLYGKITRTNKEVRNPLVNYIKPPEDKT